MVAPMRTLTCIIAIACFILGYRVFLKFPKTADTQGDSIDRIHQVTYRLMLAALFIIGNQILATIVVNYDVSFYDSTWGDYIVNFVETGFQHITSFCHISCFNPHKLSRAASEKSSSKHSGSRSIEIHGV